MSLTYPQWFVQQYGREVMQLVQQKGSRLRRAVSIENVVGKSAFVDRLGASSALKRTSRHGDSPLVSTPHSRRRLDLTDYEWGDLVDQHDKIKSLNDPTNPYTRAAAWAMGRSMDDEIILAFDGNAFAGAGGAGDAITTVTFPAAQEVGVQFADVGAGGVNTGLTIDKLRQTSQVFNDADVDEEEERFFAVRGAQLHDLLTETAVTNSDTAAIKALVDGKVDQFMGFTFIRTQRLNVGRSAADVADCMAWTKSGIKLGIGMDIRAEIAKRPDKSFSTYVYYAMSVGATRVEEERVVRILCDQSP